MPWDLSMGARGTCVHLSLLLVSVGHMTVGHLPCSGYS